MTVQKKVTFIFVAMVAMMTMGGFVATDIFVPAIPDMINHFSITQTQAQSIIGSYLIGIALMQLIYGPISDRFGRKITLIIGTLIFAISSLAITLFDNYYSVLALRVLQAIGAAAGLTLGRAIVGDIFNTKEAGRVFLMIFPFVGMTPALAPVIGAWLNEMFNWQACFYFTAIFTTIVLILVIFFLKETKLPEHRTPLRFASAIYNYIEVMKNTKFWSYTLCVCLGSATYFSYISESPFLLLQQGLTVKGIGYSYISLSIAFIVGNLVARQLTKKYSLDYTIRIGLCIFVTGGTLFFIALVTLPTVFAFSITGLSIITLGNGFLTALGTAGAVTVNAKLAGSASGVLGFLQLSAAGLGAQFIGVLSNHNPFRVGLIILILVWFSILLQVIFYFINKRKSLSK